MSFVSALSLSEGRRVCPEPELVDCSFALKKQTKIDKRLFGFPNKSFQGRCYIRTWEMENYPRACDLSSFLQMKINKKGEAAAGALSAVHGKAEFHFHHRFLWVGPHNQSLLGRWN